MMEVTIVGSGTTRGTYKLLKQVGQYISFSLHLSPHEGVSSVQLTESKKANLDNEWVMSVGINRKWTATILLFQPLVIYSGVR